MSSFPQLEEYSIGVGDRFGMQAEAQLRACILLEQDGVKVTPVWNKSNREHIIIGSEPADTRLAADSAVRKLGWKGAYCVDADHVRLETVDRFIAHSDYFTLDVGDAIGAPVPAETIEKFLTRHSELREPISFPGLEKTPRTRPFD